MSFTLSQTATPAAGNPSATATFGTAPTEGQLIAIVLSGRLTTVTDTWLTKPTGFQLAAAYDDTNDDTSAVFYKVAGVSEGTTYQFTSLEGASFANVSVAGWTFDMDALDSVGTGLSATTTATTMLSPTVTSGAGDLVIVANYHKGSTSSGYDNGFLGAQTVGTNFVFVAGAYKVSAGGSESTTHTTADDIKQSVAIVNFVEGAGGPDTTPPGFTDGPSTTETTPTGHTISSTLNESGTIFGVRMTDGATAPTDGPDVITKYNAGVTGDVLEIATAAATIATNADLVFSTGSENTPYDYYIVAQDDEGTPNVQLAATLVEATTSTTPAYTVTGPSSIQQGVEATITGTNLDTITSLNIISGSASHAQSITTQPGTTLTFTPDSGFDNSVTGSGVAGVPFTPTIAATGITPYTIQLQLSDGTNVEMQTVTFAPPATHETIQTTITVADTTAGVSLFGSTILTVEDDTQGTFPKNPGIPIAYDTSGDGLWSSTSDQDATYDAVYFSPATSNLQSVTLTVDASGADRPATGTPLLTTPGAAAVGAVFTPDYNDVADPDGITNIAASTVWTYTRVPAGGGSPVDITTGATYTAQSADIGFVLQPRLNALDDLGNAIILLGAETTEITAADGVVGDPPYYVATDGRDNGAGDISDPFLTLEAARDAMRAHTLTAPAEIIIRGGTYELPSVLALTASDSGSKAYPITWKAFTGETVILSGGRTLTNGVAAGGNFTYDLTSYNLGALSTINYDAAVLATMPPFEVFVGGERKPLCRWPTSDRSVVGGDTWNYISSAPDAQLLEFTYDTASEFTGWTVTNAIVQAFAGNDWYDTHTDISTLVGGTFTLSQAFTYQPKAGRRFAVLNVPEELTDPGEWSYASNTLTLKPAVGQESANPSISYMDSVITFDGVSHVSFDGLTIEQARKDAVSITDSLFVSISNCTVRNAAANGIIINDGYKIIVDSCDIHDVGYSAATLTGGSRDALASCGHKITNNTIYNAGRVKRAGPAAVKLQGVGVTFAKNIVKNQPHTGVVFSGNDHTVELNDIYNCCEETSDAGAIYCGRDWTLHGNKIRNNRIHDTYGYGMNTGTLVFETPKQVTGVYLDDNASGVEVTGNLFYRNPVQDIQHAAGRNTKIKNNIFITNGLSYFLDARWQSVWDNNYTTLSANLAAVPYQGIIWSAKYPSLAGDAMTNQRHPEHSEITENIIAVESTTTGSVQIYNATLTANMTIDNNTVWNKGNQIDVSFKYADVGTTTDTTFSAYVTSEGFDTNSIEADPLFLSASDLGLQIASPSRAFGAGTPDGLPVYDSSSPKPDAA